MKQKERVLRQTLREIKSGAIVTPDLPTCQHSEQLFCAGASINNAQSASYLTYTDKWSSTSVKNDLYFQEKSKELLKNTKKLYKKNKQLLQLIHYNGFQKFKVINKNQIILYSPPNAVGNMNAGWSLADHISDTEKARLASKQRAQEKMLANCDLWAYFGTFTIDKRKQDRYNFEKAQRRFTRILSSRGIKYSIVPERHKDGAIHFHGLFSAEMKQYLQEFEGKALKNRYIAKCRAEGRAVAHMRAYSEAFGYNTVEPIRNQEACVNYMTKYVLKTFDDPDFERFSKRRFFCSKGLKSPYEVMPEFVDLEAFEPVVYSRYTVKVYLRRIVPVAYTPVANSPPL